MVTSKTLWPELTAERAACKQASEEDDDDDGDMTRKRGKTRTSVQQKAVAKGSSKIAKNSGVAGKC